MEWEGRNGTGPEGRGCTQLAHPYPNPSLSSPIFTPDLPSPSFSRFPRVRLSIQLLPSTHPQPPLLSSSSPHPCHPISSPPSRHVAHMTDGDFFSAELSHIFPSAGQSPHPPD